MAIEAQESGHHIEIKPKDQLAVETHIELAKNAPYYKPSLKRYVILVLFCLNAANKTFQWTQVNVVTTKAAFFFGVDRLAINSVATIYLVIFLFLSWPACFMIERFGLRKAIVLASFGSLLGSVSKCFCGGSSGGHIAVLFLGQTLVALAEQMIFSLPSKLAAVWFPDNEVSSAMGSCVLGTSAGVALAFVVVPIFFEGTETLAEISVAFNHMFLTTAIISVIIFVLCCVFCEDAPKHPPGAARFRQIEIESQVPKRSFWGEMMELFRLIRELMNDMQFVILGLCYGCIVGLGWAVTTLLDQTLTPIWHDERVVGITGFLVVTFGALFSPFCGRVMDWSHRYKLTNCIMIFICALSIIAFAYSIEIRSLWLVYFSLSLFGIFYTGSVTAGLEQAIELTYPKPELVVCSLMNIMPNLFGTMIIYIGSYLADNYGALAINAFYLLTTCVSLILLLCTKEILRRQAAVKQVNENKEKSSN